MKRAIQIPAALLMSALLGCASYDPDKYYDANAVEKLGRVVSKEIVRWEHRPGDSSPGMYMPVPYTGDRTANAIYATALIIELLRGAQQARQAVEDPGTPIYSYRILAKGQEQFTIVSDFPGYRPGDCVRVFLSSRPDYPRMTSSSGCEAS
jgi:hypothetical protein